MNLRFKLLTALLFLVGLILAEKYYHYDSSKQKSSYIAEEENTNPTEIKQAADNSAIAIGQKIKNKTYYNYETKDGNSITFSTWGKTNRGACTFSEGSIFKDNICRFTYSFEIQNGQIEARFSDSDCEGRTTTDRIFYYDESRDVISTIVNGETFEFAREGSPYLKRNRNERQQLTKSTPTQSESGYTTGRDGRVYENAPCSLCSGTGVEKSHGSMGGGYGRVCPQCKGTGHQSY